jgi:hypothetical protein
MTLEFLSTFAHRYLVFCKITFTQAELRLVILKQLTCTIVYI